MTSYDGATCTCGSSWFTLRPGDGADLAAVTLDESGVVTGFAGTPVCVECEQPWVPRRDRLQLVL